jgi:hypothetical protein
MKMNEGSRVNLDMKDLGFLEETSVGGESAYKVREGVPARLLRLFALSQVIKENVKVGVLDASSEGANRSSIVDLIDHAGAKVVSYEDSPSEDELDCVVRSKNKKVALCENGLDIWMNFSTGSFWEC